MDLPYRQKSFPLSAREEQEGRNRVTDGSERTSPK